MYIDGSYNCSHKSYCNPIWLNKEGIIREGIEAWPMDLENTLDADLTFENYSTCTFSCFPLRSLFFPPISCLFKAKACRGIECFRNPLEPIYLGYIHSHADTHITYMLSVSLSYTLLLQMMYVLNFHIYIYMVCHASYIYIMAKW